MIGISFNNKSVKIYIYLKRCLIKKTFEINDTVYKGQSFAAPNDTPYRNQLMSQTCVLIREKTSVA